MDPFLPITPQLQIRLSDIQAHTDLIQGWLATEAGINLYRLARYHMPAGVVVELGSWKGRSTIWLASALQDRGQGKMYAVDTWEGSGNYGVILHLLEQYQKDQLYNEFLGNLKNAGVMDYVVPLRGMTTEVSRLWPQGLSISLLYIDADHIYESVCDDFNNWAPHVADGGFVIFDDVPAWPGPTKFVENLPADFECFYLGWNHYIARKTKRVNVDLPKGNTHVLPSVISTAKEWAQSFSIPTGVGLPVYEPLEEESVFIRSQPITLDARRHWIFDLFSDQSPPDQFLTRIPHGRIGSIAGAIITPDNRLLEDVSFEYSGRPIQQHTIFTLPELPPVQYESGVVAVLSTNAYFNYYHWMIEAVARIHLLQYSGIKIDKYVVNPYMMAYQSETLTMLGISEDKRIRLSAETHLEADLLIVPSHGGFTGVPPRWACRYLRDNLKGSPYVPLHTGFDRIYISRANAHHRKVLNEDKVIELLMPYGFRVVSLENMTVAEQVRLFHYARIIVAPHGAALTNVMFCEPGASVIELFCPRYVSPVYWKMSDYQSLNYYYLIGEGEQPPLGTEFLDIVGDMQINVDELRRLMDLVL